LILRRILRQYLSLSSRKFLLLSRLSQKGTFLKQPIVAESSGKLHVSEERLTYLWGRGKG
jgi:hypothetical protein